MLVRALGDLLWICCGFVVSLSFSFSLIAKLRLSMFVSVLFSQDIHQLDPAENSVPVAWNDVRLPVVLSDHAARNPLHSLAVLV